MKRKQLNDEIDTFQVELKTNGDHNEKDGFSKNDQIQESQNKYIFIPQVQPVGAVIQSVDSTNRFGVTNIEIKIMGPLAFILLFYHLTLVAYETHLIQEQNPIEGVVISWLGYFRDDSDQQWKEFRETLIIYILGMSIFVLISNALKIYNEKRPQDKFKYQIYFYLTCGIGYLIYLFQAGIIMWLFFTLSNYGISKIMYKNKFYSLIQWSYSIWILYYIYYYGQQPFQIFTYIFPILGGAIQESNKSALIPWNWVFNMTLLRVMSFCLDKNWQYLNSYKFDSKKHQEKCLLCSQDKACYKSRSEQYLETQYYDSIVYFYAYLTYPPVFIRGPQITFNAFISQVLQKQNTITRSKVIIYFVRALNNILVLELYTHLNFARALQKVDDNQSLWINFSFSECLFMGLLNLLFIWLKFLIIWRLARAFSLLDGIDCPENMNRCISNNYCFEGFWRSWHRSFNQWLIRYLFIPLGGSKTKQWNIWLVFTFVAIWHGFELKFVLWAWFICAALIPEMIIKNWVNKKTQLWSKWWFKYLCSLAATLNIWLMVLANLIGYGTGQENIGNIVVKLFEPDAFKQVFLVITSLYFLPIVQFYIRDQEHDKGF